MNILHVAINSPLHHLFDYLPPDDRLMIDLMPGQRLRVPFGKSGTRIGLIISLSTVTEVPLNKLKKALTLLDKQPVIDKEQMQLIEWVSRYYHYPIGSVAFTAIPSALRKGKPAKIKQENIWQITDPGKNADGSKLARAQKQFAILNFIKQHPHGISQSCIANQFHNSKPALNALLKKKLINFKEKESLKQHGETNIADNNGAVPSPNKEQQKAIHTIIASLNTYRTFLLNGVTGSGKTEVYLRVIQHIIKLGRQVLIMTPEIGLTPQLVKVITQRFQQNIAVLNSRLSDQERLSAWLKARDNKTAIILGTRSAIWTPLPNLGIIIIDEEHDPSYKQQKGLRYSARDVALIRAQRKKIPVLLGSATPAMESIKNVRDQRYQEIQLPNRVSNLELPKIHIYGIRNTKMYGAISQYLLNNIKQCINKKQQTLLFLNRRGYAPVMMCHHCHFIHQCPRCTMYMVLHKYKNQLLCHHCSHYKTLPDTCPECHGTQIIEIGHGTERLEETLLGLLPEAKISRIDRDTTQRRGAMQKIFNDIHAGHTDILIGTQMLSKGHHFPNVTLVGIINIDQNLFSIDYRASEKMAQIFTQISGRAGRSNNPGTVIVQTHYPEHPLLNELAKHNYQQFTELLLRERQQAQLPPFSFQALIHAESNQQYTATEFLDIAKMKLQSIKQKELEIYGPVTAPIEKRAGRYRSQLIVQAKNRKIIQKSLAAWIMLIEKVPEAKKVQWSLDVDPIDMS